MLGFARLVKGNRGLTIKLGKNVCNATPMNANTKKREFSYLAPQGKFVRRGKT